MVNFTNGAQAFDYVVVGAGTAGSVIAARLTEHPDVRVLLVEAGPAEGPEAMRTARTWPFLLGTEADWQYRIAPQKGLGGDVPPYPRGKVLGGSSSINVMIHQRGHRSAIDAWVSAGAAGWGYDDLLPYYRRSEHTKGLDPRFRGLDGPMTPESSAVSHPVARAFLDGALELGYPFSYDLNGADAEGVAWDEITAVDGIRQSAADAYLRPVRGRSNLSIMTGATAERLLFSGTRCDGVQFIHSGVAHTVRATAEVILCAGAIGSPHLLMLSGVGPADVLRACGVQPVADLPGVGANLADHPLGFNVYSTPRDMDAGRGSGNGIDVLAALRTSAAVGAPDVHVFSADFTLPPFQELNGFTIGYALLTPRSRGSVRLVSNDSGVPPVIDPDLLADERDAAGMLAALEIARGIVGSNAMKPWRGDEVLPGAGVGNVEELRRSRSIGSYFHSVGTCKMGVDASAVTDQRLQVHGLDRLRVVDASVMPSIPAANTNATVLAIAERAVDLIETRS